MAFLECLLSAVEQNVITREEAQSLSSEFDKRFAETRMSMGDDAAANAAKDALEKELRIQAIEQKRRAVLTKEAANRIKGEVLNYRDANGNSNVYEAAMGLLSHYGYKGYSSIRGRSEAITMMVQGELNAAMLHFRRSLVSGQRANLADLPDLIRALHGEKVSNPTAEALAKSISDQFETLRQRFNAAGGAIAKREDYGLPHTHDGLKIRAYGKDIAEARANWKADIRGRIDWQKTINPLTGDAVGDAGADRFLDRMFDQVTTDGWAHHTPEMKSYGVGSLATQRQEHRVLTFKSADDWLAYNTKFGTGDVIQTVFHHINGMAKDIATMEILGPNPDAMLEWLIQNVRMEVGRSDVGIPSFAKETSRLGKWARGITPGSYADYRIRGLYSHLRGRPVAASGIAEALSSAKNVMNSAMLGSAAVTAAVTDPFMDAMAKKLAGLPAMKDIFGILKMISKEERSKVLRAGAIWEEYTHVMEGEARFSGLVLGSGWSKYLVDRSMMAFGLTPLTTGRKLAHARAWHAEMGDAAKKSFADLGGRFRRTLEGFGINQEDWKIIQGSVDEGGFVTPQSVASHERALAQRASIASAAGLPVDLSTPVAEKYAEMISSWTERAVPSGTPNARSFATGNVARGTILGEVADAGLQFKSFGLSMTTLQMEAMAQIAASEGKMNAASYMATLAILTSIGGAIAIQLKNLADGKDLEDMSPMNKQFWVRSAFQGGGFGLLGDFANAGSNRFGQGFASTLIGPTIAFAGDAVGLTVGNAVQAARGEETDFAKEGVKFAGRYTPVLSSWWATRAAYRRLVLDQLQYMVDPNATASWKAQERSLKSRTGQGFWWEPGKRTPTRKMKIAPMPVAKP